MLVKKILTSENPSDDSKWPILCAKTLAYIKGTLHVTPLSINSDLFAKVTPKTVRLHEDRKSQSKATSSTTAASISNESVASSVGKALMPPPEHVIKKLRAFGKR